MPGSAIDKTCNTCHCAVIYGTPMLNSSICPGFRSADNCIWNVADCSSWQSAPRWWTTTQAIAFTAYLGMPMSRPTIIKICMARNASRQVLGKKTKWLIKSSELMKLLEEIAGETCKPKGDG